MPTTRSPKNRGKSGGSGVPRPSLEGGNSGVDMQKVIKDSFAEYSKSTSEEMKQINENVLQVKSNTDKIREDIKELQVSVSEVKEDIVSLKERMVSNENFTNQIKSEVDIQAGIMRGFEDKMDRINDLMNEMEKKQQKLEDYANDTQQHQRSFSLRIFGLKIPKDKSGNEFLKYLYDKVLVPVFQYCAAKNELSSIPDWDSVIEYGHVLPSSKTEGPPPIIIRLQSRTFLHQILKYKLPALNPNRARNLGISIPPSYQLNSSQTTELGSVFISGDMTSKNLKKINELKEMKDIKNAWLSSSGKIKYITNSPNAKVKTLNSLSDSPSF